MPKARPRHHARHARPRRKAYARRLDAQLIQQAEVNALRFGIGANLLMAIAGWLGYYYSGSLALSFDGNYALISAISCGVAIRIARHKDVRDDDYPYGHYSFESLYAFIKGLTLLAIILYALMESGVAIARYMDGVRERELQTLPILVYMGVTFVMCMGVYAYYAWQYSRTGSSSTILQVEASEALMDTLLSLGMGIALLAIALIPAGGTFEFLRWLGDPLIVILMSLAMLKMPLGIVRNSFYSLVVRERELQTLPILVYMGVTFVMCMGVYAYYAWQYRRTGSSSTILQVEASEALMDTLLSLGMGIALLAIALVPAGGSFEFLRWLGDPLIVILMSLAMLKMPLGIVRNSFYSLVGRTLRARPLRSRLERLVRKHLDGQFQLQKVHALKIGSCYEITVTLRPVHENMIALPSYRLMRERMREALQKIFPNLILEILIE